VPVAEDQTRDEWADLRRTWCARDDTRRTRRLREDVHALEEGLEHVPRPLRRCDEGEATAQCEPPLAL
jgi:hypothetical protein